MSQPFSSSTAIPSQETLDWVAAHEPLIQPLALLGVKDDNPPAVIDKVGVIPVYVKGGQLMVRLAKPHPKKKDSGLAPPGFQLSKGTRKYWDEEAIQKNEITGEETPDTSVRGAWKDLFREPHIPEMLTPETKLESIFIGALRESHEEVGTRPENIDKLYDLGPVKIPSISNASKTNTVHMYAALIKDPSEAAFGAPQGEHAKKEDVRWFPIPKARSIQMETEAPSEIETNHISFLRQLGEALGPMLGLPGKSPARIK